MDMLIGEGGAAGADVIKDSDTAKFRQGRDRGVAGDAGDRRFLGDLVRPVQAARPGPRKGRERAERQGPAGQDRRRQEPGAWPASCAVQSIPAVFAFRRRPAGRRLRRRPAGKPAPPVRRAAGRGRAGRRTAGRPGCRPDARRGPAPRSTRATPAPRRACIPASFELDGANVAALVGLARSAIAPGPAGPGPADARPAAGGDGERPRRRWRPARRSP